MTNRKKKNCKKNCKLKAHNNSMTFNSGNEKILAFKSFLVSYRAILITCLFICLNRLTLLLPNSNPDFCGLDILVLVPGNTPQLFC